ncbi:MAG: type II secretion system GspH family protein, partial [Candidatus Sumerlaeia bacterium]|nr:type II secretion system GspH family protein [Candidatus Sumerlaeia bacterium]
MTRNKNARSIQGYTFVEIFISITLFSIVTLAFLPWFQQSAKLGKITAQEITAKNIAQGLLEKMLADNYENVTTANYPEPGETYFIDRVMGIIGNVNITIKGDGWVSSATNYTITDETASWIENEWAGSTVLIIEGSGRGQRALIKSNTNNTLI